MEKFKIINYNSKPAIKIGKEHLNELKKGKYCEFAEYLKLAPEEENLILEMLPEEVLLYIFQFLSPGDLIRVASTCQTLNELSEDTNTWRNISYNYNQFFLLNKVEVQRRPYRYQENQIPIYGIIKETQLLTDDIDALSLNDPNKLKKTKSNLTAFFRRRNQNQNQNDNEHELDNLFDQTEVKNKLFEYIEKIPNPKEELISKANLIYNGIKERKEELEKNLKKREEDVKKWRKIDRVETSSVANLIFLALGFIAFLIALNVHIDKKQSSNVIYVFIPFLLPVFIFIILFFILYKYKSQFEFSIYGFAMLILFIQLLLIGLRSDSTIKGSWLLIFLPFLIFFVVLIIGSIILYQKENADCIATTPITIFIMILLFLIFLGLRLDEKVTWNYGIVFIPLFFINLFPCFLGFSFCNELSGEYAIMAAISFFCLFLIVSVPISLFEIFLVLFLEGNSKFNYIAYAFIPLYIYLGFLFCYLCVLGCVLLIEGFH